MQTLAVSKFMRLVDGFSQRQAGFDPADGGSALMLVNYHSIKQREIPKDNALYVVHAHIFNGFILH
jgi:hypothetical protein